MKAHDQEDRVYLLRAHYERVWGPVSREIRWEQGPVEELPSQFQIMVFNKDATTDVLATCGLSFGGAQSKIELFLYCPTQFGHEARLCEILTVTAHYHLTGGNLGIGHSVDWGEPIVTGSLCRWGYLSWPYLEGKVLGDIDFNNAKVFWLVPLTRDELLYKKRNGVDALEGQFESKQLNYIDYYRASIC